MPITLKKTLIIIVAALLLSVIAFAAFADDDRDEYEDENERYEDQGQDQDDDQDRDDDHDRNENDSKPDDNRLNMVEYFSGSSLNLAQFEGKAFLINFFTEWCPYCMEEMPDIKRAYDTYDPKYLEIILVHPWVGEDADNTASVVERFGLEGVTTIEDPDLALKNLVGVPGYPTSIFIGPDGFLYYAIASKIDYNLISSIFDDLGVPHRGAAKTVTVSSPSNNTTVTNTNAAPDATTSATP